MVKKTFEPRESTLGTWLGRGPIKFALYALFLPFALMLLYMVIALAVTGGQTSIAAWPIMLVGAFGGFVAVYKLVTGLRATPMDRRSFVAVSTGGFIVGRLVGLAAVFLMGFLFVPMTLAFYNPMANPAFSFGMIFILIILGLMGAYACGVLLVKIYATYLRAVDMGVSRTKAALSLPFSMHWMPGYFLDGPSRRKTPTITIRADGFRAMVDWIVATHANTWITLVIMVVIGGILYGFGWMTLFAIPPVIFIVWMLVAGPDNMRKNIGGAFANVAIIVNILTLVMILGTGIWAGRLMHTQSMTYDITSEITLGEE